MEEEEKHSPEESLLFQPSSRIIEEYPKFYYEPPTKKHADGNFIVKIENVHKTYLIGVEGVSALRGVSLTVERGEFLCILGTSGGGKTTLMNIIGTIDRATKGHVSLCNERIRTSTKDNVLANLRLTKIGFVFQSFNLISSMTALENVELPMLLLGRLSRSQVKQRAIELLTTFGLDNRLTHFPNMLSGGEQQRVTIARALANQPDLLLLDEPTGDLDTKNTETVMKILIELNREGKTLIMVTHDVALKNFAHRVVRVADGKIIRGEEITEDERQAAIAQLESGESLLRTGVNSFITRDMGVTTVRKPEDYPALRET